MAKQKPLERYVSAGMAFSQVTRKRAERLVRDLVKEGEVGREQASDWVEELLTRSRRSAEHLTELVRHEVKRQVDQLGLVDSDDVGKIVERFVSAARSAGEQTMRTVTERAGTARRVGEQEMHKARTGAESVVATAAERVQGAAKTPARGRKRAAAAKAPSTRAPAVKATRAKKTASRKVAATTPPVRAAAKKATPRSAPGRAAKAPATAAPAKKAAAPARKAASPAVRTAARKAPTRATRAPARKATGASKS